MPNPLPTPHRAVWTLLWRLLLWVLLAVITWLAVSPRPPAAADLGWDKLNHASAFLVLAFCACQAHARARWRSMAALLAYGVLIELLQSQVPNRSADAADVLADAVGIALGLGLAMLAAHWLPAFQPKR